MGRSRRDRGVDGADSEDGSDSSSGSDSEDLHRRRRKSSSHGKEQSKRSRSNNKHKSERSGKRKKRSIAPDTASGSSSSSATSSHDSCNEHHHDRSSSKKTHHKRGKRKRDKKEKKKKRQKKHRKKESHSPPHQPEGDSLERNYALADALYVLLEKYPALSGDLPIMLIRLCGGTTFDFSQMPVSGTAQCLDEVFSCLKPFGVARDEDSSGSWKWNNPAGNAPGQAANAGTELTLVRVVRALLEQIGLTIPAIDDFVATVSSRSASAKLPPAAVAAQHGHKGKQHTVEQQQKYREEQRVLRQTTDLLKQFGQDDMAKELAGLISMILDGESVALSGLPNAQLRTALESLFDTCGLEVCEMEASSEDDDDDDDDEGEKEQEKTNHQSEGTGYGLPETNDEESKALLQSVLQVCRTTVETNSMPVVKGPMLPPKGYDASAALAAYEENPHESSSDEEEDEEGPLPAGLAKAKSSAEANELVKAKAARRARELECVKHGVDFDPSIEGNAREEWMLVPGKFDFLSAVKSGQPIRSRQFDSKSKAGVAEKAVDPKIRAEIRAIHEAHEEARGPSLMEQHRAMKRQEAEDKEKSSGSSWKWSRDKDLDAGRRVDKDALNMILGGAGKDLKSKFH